MKWKAYEKYKDSGIEWLGEVPDHWTELRLKYLASFNDDVIPETTKPEYELSYVDITAVDPVSGIKQCESMRFRDAPSRARRKVQHGDIVFATVRPYLRAIALIVDPLDNLVVSTGFAVVRPSESLHSGFASHVLHTPYFVGHVVSRAVGVSYPAVGTDDISGVSIALPEPSEQHAIAAFLDRETARIDTLIEKKKRQIELLQEKRTALISHAVTKGLDPNVKMKDSGIEWLGEVPEHWDVVSLKRYLQVNSGSFLPNRNISSKESETSGVSVIGGNGVMGFTEKANIYNDTIAIGRVGALCGNVHLIRAPAWITDNALMLSRVRQFQLEFLKLLLEVADLNQLAKKNAQPLVTGTMIGSQHGILPPFQEQRCIAAFLDCETSRIDALIEKVQQSIDTLREYRSALITAAVTGQIDVREEVSAS